MEIILPWNNQFQLSPNQVKVSTTNHGILIALYFSIYKQQDTSTPHHMGILSSKNKQISISWKLCVFIPLCN